MQWYSLENMSRHKYMRMFWYWTIFFFVCNSELLHSEAKNLHVVPRFFMNLVKNKADQILEAAGGRTQCAKDLKTLFSDAVFMKRWALEMFDASAKLPSGLLSGNIYMTGSFDQCLNVNVFKNESTIHGQYCTVILTPSGNNSKESDFFTIGQLKDFLDIKTNMQTTEILKLIKLTYGLCIPHTCSIENLQTLWNYIEKTFKMPFRINFVDMMCSSNLKPISPFEIDKYIITFFGIYIIILLLSTCYDLVIYQYIKGGDQDNIWISFSLYTNAKKIFTIKDVSEEVSYLHSISGLKVLSMLWVIYGHRVVMNLFSGTINLIYTHNHWKHNITTTFILSGSYAVDTFLVLSGLLLSYGTLSYCRLHKTKKIPVVALYIYRFLRINPALLALILFYISIYKNLTDGPIWPLTATKSAIICSKTWFATLFFVNNLLDVNNQCVEQAWYLAVDSQLFFLSPIMLICLIKKPLKTCLACIGICILSGIYTFIITVRNNYGAIYFESNKAYQHYVYQPTIVRLPPWFIGFIFGYITFKYNNLKIPKVARIFAWNSVVLTLTGLILVHLVFTRSSDYNAINAAIFNSCARQLWGVAIGMIVFLCTTDKDGLINKFLSLSIFRRVVRISYSVFLTHFAVLGYFVGGKKHSTYFRDILNVHDFMGDLFFVFIVATVWCLAFESPFIAVAKYIYKKEMASKSSNSQLLQRKKKKKNKNNYLVCVYKYNENVADVPIKKME